MDSSLVKPKEQCQAQRESFLDDCAFAGRAWALNKFSSKTVAETINRDDKEEVCFS